MTQPEFSTFTPESIARRRFMVGAAGLTFGVALGTWQPLWAQALALTGDAPTGSKGTEMSPWVTIFSDGTIGIMSPAVEMGQGSLTSLPLILAEELDADWEKVRIVVAPPNDELYKNPAFGFMYTAGSNAVTSYFKDLRRFGAQVRKVLLINVAKRWN